MKSRQVETANLGTSRAVENHSDKTLTSLMAPNVQHVILRSTATKNLHGAMASKG